MKIPNAVIAAFGLVPSVAIIITEFFHFLRLWTYNPTDLRNQHKGTVYSANDEQIKRFHRNHLGFIHHSLLNDQNAQEFRGSICKEKAPCQYSKLRHKLLYHTLDVEPDIDFGKLSDDDKKSFIAFHQTTKDEALKIAQKGFPYGDNIGGPNKEYLHLRQNIFFTRSCKTNDPSVQSIICVRLNLGRIKTVDGGDHVDLNQYFAKNDGQCDTVYVKNTGRLHLRMPAQIEKWIISINGGVPVNDHLDKEFYRPCT